MRTYMLRFERRHAALAYANEGTTTKWVRVPMAIKVCGLGKTRLYELLNETNGRIKTLVLKSPGAKKGARLIHLPSLFTYLEQLAEQQQKELNS
jgi:hypothetical protein